MDAFEKRCIIYCADVGSVAAGNFAWARGFEAAGNVTVEGGTDISELVGSIASDVDGNGAVTLGMECPLFVPLRSDPTELTQARHGEGCRPWSAAAGAGSLTTIGLVETVWVLDEVKHRVQRDIPVFLDWNDFRRAGQGLFLWEAFVTVQDKGRSHFEDAKRAVLSFAAAMPDVMGANAISENSVYSLIGAALLGSRWSSELALLRPPCIVVRA